MNTVGLGKSPKILDFLSTPSLPWISRALVSVRRWFI
jgi:hypothetical protein